jgi:hypothetical protein
MSTPGMSESIPQSPYNRGVRRKAVTPMAITKKEAVISFPNLSTNLFILAYLLDHYSAIRKKKYRLTGSNPLVATTYNP